MKTIDASEFMFETDQIPVYERASSVYRDAEDITNLKSPAGFEFTGEFRIPLSGEFLLGPVNSDCAIRASHDYCLPRLILKKVPVVKNVLLRYTETRKVKYGDYARSYVFGAFPVKVYNVENWGDKEYHIFTPEEVE